MADGRDVEVWDRHAEECREAERALFEFDQSESSGGWLRRKVLEVLSEGATVVDVGCGPGYWRNLFEGFEYVGFDQSPGMLKLAAELPTPKVPAPQWLQGNAREVSNSLPLNHFEMVFTASVLQHNRNEPDKREIVESIHKIAKEGGYLLCTENTYRADNCPQLTTNPDFTDNYTMTPGGWEAFMLPLGFKLLAFNGQSEYLYQKV